MTAPDCLYHRDGDRYVPTELTRGPWSPVAQHGGPPAALLARAVHRFDGGDRMHVARLTVELMRPVPLDPLEIRTRMLRPGKRVQLVEASLICGDTEVARAVALRIRRAPVEIPEGARVTTAPPPPPVEGSASLPPWNREEDEIPAYHSHAVEHRFVSGAFDRPGPATDWIRLRVPLVGGEETLPLSRAAAAGDFGNGISWMLSRLDGYSFINPDLTIYLFREPMGEWICLEAQTLPGEQGVGLAESRLYDAHGPVGRALQSLLLDRT